MNRFQLDELLTRWIAGELSADEFAQLESLLETDPEARRRLRQHAMLDDVLRDLGTAEPTETPAPMPIAVDIESFSGWGITSSLLGHHQKWFVFSLLCFSAVTAAVLLLSFTAWLFVGGSATIVAERERQPVASLSADVDAQWERGFGPSQEEQLIEGQVLKLAAGRAQISMSCGAELVLKAPCSVTLGAPNKVLLQNGVLSVHVADWTEDFTVATDSVQILDLGKQFVVSADPKTGAVEAHALDGKLRVQTTNVPPEQRRGLLVSSGEAIRIHPSTNTSKRLKANSMLFDPGFNDARPFKPLEIHNTGRGLRPGDEDPHWRIVSSSADDFRGPRYAIVCNALRGHYLPNDPGTSQWISISNPDIDTPPRTMYTFETEVDLTGYDLSTVTIVANALADNGVTGVRVNGQRVVFKPWIHQIPGNFHVYRKIEITGELVEGVNRIQFDVWNGEVGDTQQYNAMAFRVEWQAFGRLAPYQTVRGWLRGDEELPLPKPPTPLRDESV